MSYTTTERLAEKIKDLETQGIKRLKKQVLKFDESSHDGFVTVGEELAIDDPVELKDGEWLSVLFYDGHSNAQIHIDPDGYNYGDILSKLRNHKSNRGGKPTYKQLFQAEQKEVRNSIKISGDDGASLFDSATDGSEEGEFHQLTRLEDAWRGEVLSILEEAELDGNEAAWKAIKRAIEVGELSEQRRGVFNRLYARKARPLVDAQFSKKQKKLQPWKVRALELRNALIQDNHKLLERLILEGFIEERKGLYKLGGSGRFIKFESVEKAFRRLPS